MNELTTTETMMIRACKSLEPNTRLLSVHRRYWLTNDMTEDQCWDVIVNVLVRVVTKYHPEMTLGKLIEHLHPSNMEWRYYHAKSRSFSYQVAQVLSAHIRHSAVDVYPNFRSPKKFRSAV